MNSRAQQQLVDALQTAALTAQRIAVTARQQSIDASECVGALERIVAQVQILCTVDDPRRI